MWLTDAELAEGAKGQEGAWGVTLWTRSDMTEPEVLDAPRAPRSGPSTERKAAPCG